MFLGIVCVALLAAPAWGAAPRLQDMRRADEIYQEQLEKLLATVPKAISDEARMNVVSRNVIKFKNYQKN